MNRQVRIPTIVALVMLVLGVGGSLFLLERGVSLISRANSSTIPKEVTISNVSDTSFTVSWITDAPTASIVEYSNQGLITATKTVRDSRDQTQGQLRQVHAITIGSLIPKTNYQFQIISGGKVIKDDRFVVTTGPTLATPDHVISPAFGKVTDQQNTPLSQAIVYASFDGSQTVSTLVDNGTWVLPRGQLRASDGNRYYIPTKSDEEHLFFVNAQNKSTVRATIETDAPLAQVQLGQDYDFTHKMGGSGLTIAQSQNFGSLSGSVNTTAGFQLLSPSDNAAIPSGKPGFKGTGIAGQAVILTISGLSVQTAKITIDSTGNWNWTPTSALAPGNYTVTAASFDTQNNPLVLSHTFIILKSGTQVLAAATPSASITPSASPVASPHPSATPLPSASLIPSPSATSTPPVTGNNEPTIIFLGLGMMLIGSGIIAGVKYKHLFKTAA